MTEYKYLNKYEQEIILLLHFTNSSFSTRTIAHLLNRHVLTAKKNLESLEKKEVVQREAMNNKVLWRLII